MIIGISLYLQSGEVEERGGEMVVVSTNNSSSNGAVVANTNSLALTTAAVTTTTTLTTTSNSSVVVPSRRPPPPPCISLQPPIKKARYDGCLLGNKPTDDIEVRAALIKWKHCRMNTVRELFNCHIAEQYFLNHNGNLMEMSSWLKKPTPELLTYHKEQRLDGDTSSFLPSAKDLSALSSRGEVTGTRKEDQQDLMVEKARHEAYVVARIAQLRKEGLWTEKKLPKVHEPARPKCHWDYLLEEMVWLSADFAQERKWKKAAAKKCAKMVQKYFQDKELAAERAQKDEEMKLRKIAAFMAREVRTFWNNVEKLVHYKINSKHEEKKKIALDQQLSFIVDQTEKYSGMLAESMKRPVDSSAVSTRSETPSVGSLSDGKLGGEEEEEGLHPVVLCRLAENSLLWL